LNSPAGRQVSTPTESGQTVDRMDVWTVVFFCIGVAALVGGAEGLIRGATGLAARTGISAVVIGLTVVAFGTSAPELAVSLGAAYRDEADLAVGNVIGSNIANVLLVLGLAAAVSGGLVVAQRIVRVDVPIMIAVSVLFFVFALDNELSRIEGAVFIVVLVVYLTWTVVHARRSAGFLVETEYEDALEIAELRRASVFADVGLVVVGLLLLVAGSSALVESATDIATSLGVSSLVVGLTVVAVGTSLPEIATSVLAAARGQRDMAVGNAIGSNLFNILAVLGTTSLISPSAIPVPDDAIRFDLPVMIAVAIACLPVFVIGYSLMRWEGLMFLGFYGAYITWLVIDSAGYTIRDQYTVAVLGFLLPLSVVTFVVISARERRARRPENVPAP